jgi:uncharacterized protein
LPALYYKSVNTGAAVRFEWDARKAESNLAKHGVAFKLAEEVWNDPLHIILPDRFENGEMRWHAIGLVGTVVMLVVVHTYPDDGDEDLVRIIGARRVTRQERKRYENESA